MHEAVGGHSRPGLLEFHGCSGQLFFDARRPNLFRFVRSQRDDSGAEEQEYESNSCGKGDKGGRNPEQADTTTAHGRDFMAPGEQSKSQ